MLLLLATLAHAQSEEPIELRDDVKIIYKSTTQIDFEGVTVDGIATKPSMILTLERPRGEFTPLIHLREHFNDELAESTHDVR